MSSSNDRVESGSRDDVATLYCAYEGHDNNDRFHNDFVASIAQAAAANDHAALERLQILLFEYFEFALPKRGARRLTKYLESIRVWRWFGDSPIYKTVDT